MCVSTVFSVSHRRLAMPALVRPSAISESTSRSRGVSSSSALRRVGAATSVATTCGSSAEPPGGDPPRRVEEVVNVEHAVLEQIAEAAAGGDELDDVAGLDVLGEHQHGRAGMLATDLGGRAGPLVVVVGRHAHVDDREVGRVLLHERQQRVRVSGAADDLVPVVLDQAGQSLAQERGVLGDHDAHGSSTSIRVPPPVGAEDLEAAALRGDAIGHAGQTRARVGRGPADAVIADDQAERPVVATGRARSRATASRA